MQSMDIILVSFNSEKWINSLLHSLEHVNYPLKNLNITFVDNNSTDKSLLILNNYQNKSLFGTFQVFNLQKNIGFGPANNYGAARTKESYIFFLNIDTELEENAISELMSSAQNSSTDTGMWECRQFPYEHPKVYNPITMEVSWCSAAAIMVRREYFEFVGMFDNDIFMYAEDVDLSWRFRANNLKIVYVPISVIYHFTYQSVNEVKPNQFYNSTYNNLMLRYKFGSLGDILKGYVMYYSLLAINGPLPQIHKKIILKNMAKSLFEGFKFRKWYKKNKTLQFKPLFKGWDYELTRDGAFYVNEFPESNPLISILVRTCERPNVLREAIRSIRNQTYKNIEVIIVEDGQDTSRKMIEEEFYDLNIKYTATMQKVGRCIAGNIAMENATGKYLNFLDDDDLLYADHVEVLCLELLRNPTYKAAYSIAFETPIEVLSTEPYQYRELFHNVQHRQSFNRLVLLHHNYFPIQTVMFSKEIFNELGGIDPSLEVLEDWDLWLRYALKYDFLFVEKLTSIYRIPALKDNHHERQELFDKYLSIVREKHFNKNIEIPIGHIFKDAESILNRPQSIIYKISKYPLQTLIFKVRNKIYSKLKRILLK